MTISLLTLIQYSMVVQAGYAMSVLSTFLLFVFPSPSFLPTADALAFSPPKLQLPDFLNPGATIAAKKPSTFSYTHLECNGQLWRVSDGESKASVVVDPLASQLDFGIPDYYRANKLALTESATIDLICEANPSHCLLTMGLDDHTHLPTLGLLRERMPNLQYVVAPSCESKLLEFGMDPDSMTVLDHGETFAIGDGASVTATRGALVGPPWQKRENGILLELNGNGDGNNDGNGNREDDEGDEGFRIYYEPHADIVLDDMSKLRADVVVSPVTKQSLPAQVPSAGRFTLVHGGDRALEIAERLGARVVVPLGNGVLDIEGPLAGLVIAEGGVGDFEELVESRNAGRPDDDVIRVERAIPGVTLSISV